MECGLAFPGGEEADALYNVDLLITGTPSTLFPLATVQREMKWGEAAVGQDGRTVD
jgi:hypothetical protein